MRGGVRRAFWTTFELNNAADWAPPISLASVLGAPGFNPWAGLPINMNPMVVASIYDGWGLSLHRLVQRVGRSEVLAA